MPFDGQFCLQLAHEDGAHDEIFGSYGVWRNLTELWRKEAISLKAFALALSGFP